MTGVLATNPLTTGAYHDLGKMYICAYEMPTAWECFRLARKVTADHPLMKDIDDLEKKIETDFPDFF